MDGSRVDHTKSGKERQILHGITHMWNLRYNTHQSIYKTETDVGKTWFPKGEEAGIKREYQNNKHDQRMISHMISAIKSRDHYMIVM